MNRNSISYTGMFLLGLVICVLLGIGNARAQTVPVPPSYLVATEDDTFNRIRLEWRDGSDDEDGFRIERKTTGAYELLADVGPVPGHGDQTSYTDEGLAWTTSYTYRVLAYNSAGDSTYSNEDTATTPEELINQIVNGEFELDPVNNNGWETQIWTGSVTFEWATDQVHGGAHSAKIVCSGSEGGFNKDDLNRIPLTGGYSYDLSIWAKLENVSGDGVWIWTEQFNSSGGVIGGTRWDSGKLVGTRDWTKISYKFTAAPDAATMNLYIHLKDNGTVWYDDAVVAEGDPPPPPGTVVVDANQVEESWHRFYEGSVGACHPITVLSSSYGRNIQGALTRGHDEAGFQRIRPHGILNSSVGVYSEPGDVPTYNWTTFDQIYDTVRSIGMYPIVELSHTPPDLAAGGSTCFWYNGHAGRINPPDNYPRWRDLIKEIVLHCEARYGVDEIRNQWYFEVYNEPDLPYFFAGNSTDYLKMYDWAAEGVIQADATVRLGGPATSGGRLFGSDPDYIHPEQFLKHVMQETNYANGQIGTKCDFISYHRYANDGGYNGGVSKPISIVSYHDGIINLMAQYGFTGETMCTEWAPTYDSIPVHSDTESAASFIAKSIHLLNDNGDVPPPDIYSWWVISDIFEEWNAYGYNFMPAYGGEGPGGGRTGDYGLILRGDPNIPDSFDVEKTSFNAYKILHQLTDDRLSFTGGTTADGVNGTATIASDSLSIQVLVYNHVDGGTADSTQSEQVTLRVENIPFAPGQVNVSHVVVDRTRSNSYRTWQDMGSPLAPSAGQWSTLRASAALTDYDPPATVTLTDDSFEKVFDANVYSVHLITLESNTSVPPPVPVSNLEAVPTGPGQIMLTWTDNAEDEIGFRIERKEGSGAYEQIAEVGANVMMHPDNAVSYPTTYTYRVFAYNAGGNSSPSNESSATPPPGLPQPPAGLSAVAGDSRVTLTWTANSETNPAVLYYKVFRSTTSGGPYTCVAVVFGGTNIIDSNVYNDTTYYYVLQAVDVWPNESTYSIEVSATPQPLDLPDAPTNLVVTDTSYDYVSLGWTDSSDNETGFRIERADAGEVGLVGEGVMSFTDTGLVGDTTYEYTVIAFNNDGDSIGNPTVSGTTDLPPLPEPAPSDLAVTVISGTQIDLTWTDNTDYEEGYEIERKTTGDFELIGTTSVNETIYHDTGLIVCSSYTYRVRAYNATGVSSYSNEVSATTLCNPIEYMVDDADAAMVYGGTWSAQSGWGGRYDDTVHESNDVVATAELTFTGFQVELLGDKQQWGGTADVYIDDVLTLEDVSFYDAGGQLYQQLIFSIGSLPYGEHTVRIEKSGGDWIYVDAIRYYGY